MVSVERYMKSFVFVSSEFPCLAEPSVWADTLPVCPDAESGSEGKIGRTLPGGASVGIDGYV